MSPIAWDVGHGNEKRANPPRLDVASYVADTLFQVKAHVSKLLFRNLKAVILKQQLHLFPQSELIERMCEDSYWK